MPETDLLHPCLTRGPAQPSLLSDLTKDLKQSCDFQGGFWDSAAAASGGTSGKGGCCQGGSKGQEKPCMQGVQGVQEGEGCAVQHPGE